MIRGNEAGGSAFPLLAGYFFGAAFFAGAAFAPPAGLAAGGAGAGAGGCNSASQLLANCTATSVGSLPFR